MQKQTWLKIISPALRNSKATIQPQWPVQNVLAFTTTRLSPFFHQDNYQQVTSSHHKFGSFNLGEHVGDDLAQVDKNRQELHQLLPENIYIQWLTQVHGNQVLTLTQENITPSSPLVADAMITREKNIALSIMTADCLPILLASKSGDEIAAIHGGWRSLNLNIIENTLNKMQTPVGDIHAWLGPCIGAEAFEVGAEVKKAFIDMSLDCKNAFKPIEGTTEKYLADLQQIATILLNLCNLKNISKLSDCTFSQGEQYYSYRRDGQTGRMATLICRN